MKTKVFLLALFIMNIFYVSAQNSDEVTLVVSADGVNKEEAVKTALRSAIEQAYGTFVSANTSILNDEVVKDEVITLSFGNIKQYKELSSEILPNGSFYITLQTTVSVSKLINYAQNKGAEVEFAGATFAMNIKMEELNTRNEEKIIANMLSVMERLYMNGFEYKLSVSKVQADGRMTADIDVYPNENALKAYELFYNTLGTVSIDEEKIKEYKEINKEVYTVGLYSITSSEEMTSGARRDIYERTEGFTFRSEETLKLLGEFFNYTYPKALLNIYIGTEAENSQIDIIASKTQEGSSGFGQWNKDVYGEDINEIEFRIRRIPTDRKEIFIQGMQAYVSHLSSYQPLTGYSRYYIAREHLLNYIQAIEKIENFCYFSYSEDFYQFHGVTDNAYIARYPKHKEMTPVHHIQLTMQIPLEDLMKISKFTITRNNE